MSPMVKRLIYKDWYLNRWALLGWTAAGAVALLALGLGGEAAFLAGSILLLTALVAVGIHLVMSTVVYERSQQTLAFVMSLPLSFREYTTGKILANVLIFGTAWAALVIGTVAVLAGRGAIPDGLIPFAVVVLIQTFVGYCLTLALALVSESQAWTVGGIVASNLLLQAVIHGAAHTPSIARHMSGNTIVWSPAILGVLGAEVLAILLLLALTFYLQSRKTHFI